MGRRISGSCKCGTCNSPLAVGIPYTSWSAWATSWVAGGGPLPIAYAQWAALHGITLGSWVYLLDDDDDITRKDYLGAGGLDKSRIDVLIYGFHKENLATPTTSEKFTNYPTAGGSEESAVDTYLADGGVLIIDLAPLFVGFSPTGTQQTARNNNIAGLDTWLTHLGSTVTIKNLTDFNSSLPTGGPTSISLYSNLIPSRGAFALNPDTWLTTGQDLAHRISSVIEYRAVADLNRQLGYARHLALNPAINNAISDITGTTTEPYIETSPNATDSISYSLAPNLNVGAYITTSSPASILWAKPMANRVTAGSGGGSYDMGGNYRINYIYATAETLPSGGRLLVTAFPMNKEFGTGSYDQTYRLWHLLKHRLQPSCRFLTTGLVHRND